jgi:alpha-N-arabinofuranosidase
MKPGEYATLYRQFITQFPVYTEPFFVATGPRGHSQDMDLDWTRGFFAGLQGHPRSRVHGLGLHFYTDFRPTSVIPEKSTAREWYAVLAKGLLMEPIIEKHWAIMGEFDPEHFTKFVIDEWGTWYATGALIAPGYILSQIITLRDAVHAALTFDVFNRHVEKIAMANIAQTVNCLHSLFLAHEDKYTRTPAYYTFEMYRPHMGARRVPLRIKIPELTVPVLEGTAKLPGLSGSASIREKRLTVTLTNPSLDAAVAAWIRLAGGARVTEARGSVLTHENIAAANTFENPHKVEPAKLSVNISGGAAQVTIPKQAVVALELLIS